MELLGESAPEPSFGTARAVVARAQSRGHLGSHLAGHTEADHQPALHKMQEQILALTAELRSRDATAKAERHARDAEQAKAMQEVKRGLQELLKVEQADATEVKELLRNSMTGPFSA